MKKNGKTAIEYRSMTTSVETYLKLDRMREEKRADLKLPGLSWNEFFTLLVREHEEHKAKAR